VTSQQMQDGGWPPFWRSLNHHISVKNCAILIKFGKLQQILNPMTVTWPKIENSRWRRPLSWKSLFLAITHRPIVRFQRNLVLGSRTVCRRGLHDKNCKFLKSKMADGRHFKSPYLSEKSSDFDEIWYTTSDIEPDYSHVTKNFLNSRWRRPPS